ncbi:hypothetical protein DK847_12480 [Aestuariivirga litoralis]|uniref:Uncharacterized protein n=1 Tax=Aestuariivirga litoralis TaxID=2650924 RepID=A0A2W2AVG2_9HYPH|nr:hypothetical protein [Aestuariivirga litoralis]PZF76610.1 hypothetical protein DK847_12480 [Aestuariivirga litoralis]
MKPFTLAAAATLLAMLATPALANPPKFTASCPTGIEVKSNGKGKVRINGTKATVKTFSSTAWEARANGVSIDFGVDGSELTVTYTGKGGANGICQVTSSAAPSSSGGAGGNLTLAPSKDQEACLAAVSNKTNNGEVVVLDTNSSEANNTVIIGVGKDKARWQCLVKNGRVAEVMSLTDEGAL